MKKNFNRKLFAIHLAQENPLFVDKELSYQYLTQTLQSLQELLAQGHVINFRGFGSFSSFETKQRNITIPGTAQKIAVPTKKRVKFKAGKELGQAINQAALSEEK